MSLRPGLLPSLVRAARPTVQKRGFHFLPNSTGRAASNPFKRAAFQDTHAVARAARPAQRNNSTLMYSIGLGLAGFALTTKAARCDAMPGAPVAPPAAVPRAMEAEHVQEQIEAKSIVSLPTLTFGAVCGICAGVFVKKGFKLVAFFLGGVFVLLQVSLVGPGESDFIVELGSECWDGLWEPV